MSFLYPAFLIGALAIALPIVLHLLRRDVAPEVRFSAVRLLKKSPVERSRRRRLRDMLLLAARITALLLLATAFARPFAPGAASAMLPLRIIAVDRSYSMSAPGVFDRALAMARAAVDEAAFGERVAVIAFDERANVLAQPGGAAEAKAALADLGPGEGGTRYPAVLAQAAELASGGGGRLVLITDLQRAGWEGESRARVPSSLQVEVRDVGAAAGNVALVDAKADAGGVRVSIRNASAQPRTGAVTLARDGREVARATYRIAPHETADVPIEASTPPGPLMIAITDDEGYPADNVRHLLLGEGGEPAVLVITSVGASGFYLQRALEAAEGSGLGVLRPRLVSAADVAGGRSAAIERHRAIVLLSTNGLERTAREGIAGFVRSGGGMVVAASPDVDPAVVASMFGWPPETLASQAPRPASLTATDVRHPIFRPFGGFAANLGGVRFTQAWRIDGAPWHVAARFDDGAPALVERTEGQGRVVLFASDLDRRWNDFPLHPAFVPFVAETLRHVASNNAPTADAFVVGRVPPGLPTAAGVHRLESGRVITINVDPRESATTAMTADEFAAMLEPGDSLPLAPPQARDTQTEERQSLWQYGLLLMLGVLVAESFVGRRA